MTPELAYFLKINAGIALFYAFYRLFFYKDTFFPWRRTTLLCFFALSLVYPMMNWQEWVKEQEPMVAIVDLYANVVLPEWSIEAETPTTDWKSILLSYGNYIYCSGVVLLLLRFLIQLGCIIRLRIKCHTENIKGTRVHILKDGAGPFSFFHWIFIHPASHTPQEMGEILTHELTHSRQYHSVDVIFSELMCIVCWVNPFAWLMNREVRSNLEYIADNRVLQTGHDYQSYQFHLLGLAHQKAAATLSNSFNVLPLKNRIKMMNKKRTKEIGRAKYLMFLPLAVLLMIISNIEAVARTTEKLAKEIVQTVEPQMASQAVTLTPPQDKKKEPQKKENPVKDDSAIFETVEQMPEYPGGIASLMNFLSQNIKYPAQAHAKGIQGRVIVQFVVEKDGTLNDQKIVKPVDPDLDAEALRVLQTMPNWTPGKQHGQAVRVKYAIPVMFRLQEPKAEEIKTLSEIVAVGVASESKVAEEPNVIFEVVEQMPKYPGGIEALMKHFARNIKYPIDAQKQRIEGRVIVEIVIDKEGNVTIPQVKKSVSPTLDAEAIRVIGTLSKWEPGMQRGKAVAVRYTLPIVFRLQALTHTPDEVKQ